MKFLNDYIDEAMSATLKKYGAFYAFSNQQFDDAKTEGVKYISVGSGLIVPKDNYSELLDNIDKVIQNGIDQDVSENGIKNIIWRELGNHECQFVNSPESAVQALKNYPITLNQILDEWDEYIKHCIENDLY